jgi:transposase
MDLKKQLPLLKKKEETAWLKETYSQCLQQKVNAALNIRDEGLRLLASGTGATEGWRGCKTKTRAKV